MTVIEAAHYEETRQRLTADPIIIAMAHGLADVHRSELAHDDGTPKHEFMLAANKEYRERGGTDGGHLGAVPEALLRVLDSGEVRPTKVVTYHATRDSVDAWRDEDRAMAHVDIPIEDPHDLKSAKQGLVDYMVKEAGYLLSSKYASDVTTARAHEMLAKVADVYTVEFEDGDESWDSKSFEVSGLVFNLVRTQRVVQ